MDEFLKAAIEEARHGLAEGGIPIGSVWSLTIKSSAADIIVAFNKGAPFYTQRWIAWKMLED